MKMLYNESAPEEYQPPYFRDGSGDGDMFFERKPFSM